METKSQKMKTPKKSEGKRFEQNFKNSMPTNVFCYRFKDGTASWSKSDNNVRFQHYNICDFMAFNGKKLFLLELKTHKGKCLPLACIREKQLEELMKASVYPNVIAGLVVYFPTEETVYFLSIDKLAYFLGTETRKSIPISFFKENGLVLPCIKKQVNIAMNLTKIFNL